MVDRLNTVFNSTAVTQGVGRTVVTAKGMDTEVGRIAALVQTTPQDPTPLQVEVGRIGRRLSIAVTYTGDHPMTAARIASDLDVSPPGTPAVSGIDLVGFNALNARSETVSAFRGLFANRWGVGCHRASALLQVAVVHVGWLNRAFTTVPLAARQWLVATTLASAVLGLRSCEGLCYA